MTFSFKAIKRPGIKLLLYIMLPAIFINTSCKKHRLPEVPTVINLRILNATSWDFFDCTLYPPQDANYNYGRINIDSTSQYQTFQKLYSYCKIILTMNNKQYGIIPYDYFGETPLSTGKYTYKLTYLAPEDRIKLELIRD